MSLWIIEKRKETDKTSNPLESVSLCDLSLQWWVLVTFLATSSSLPNHFLCAQCEPAIHYICSVYWLPGNPYLHASLCILPCRLIL